MLQMLHPFLNWLDPKDQLHPSDWIAIGSAIIACVGIIVTFYFSLRVYQATKETAKATQATADLAAATLELNKTTLEKQEVRDAEYRKAMRLQYRRIIMTRSIEIRSAVTSIDGLQIHKALSVIERKLPIPSEELAKFFSAEEVEKIDWAEYVFDSYMNNYYKSTYNGHEIGELVSYAPQPYEVYDTVIKLLNEAP